MNFMIAMRVPIDRAWRDDSNGGHIVFWSILTYLLKNRALEAEFGLAGRILTPFLTETILKFGSKQADYTPNR